jgi:hypothetical protein
MRAAVWARAGSGDRPRSTHDIDEIAVAEPCQSDFAVVSATVTVGQCQAVALLCFRRQPGRDRTWRGGRSHSIMSLPEAITSLTLHAACSDCRRASSGQATAVRTKTQLPVSDCRITTAPQSSG